MREEIEAAALFITKLVNKNLSQCGSATQCGSSASSIHSSASSTSSSSESPPSFDEQATSSIVSDQDATITTTTTTNNNNKVEQFRQCLTNALYERFHNHWFPDQPTKGQAYRCIRLNEWDRHDITLQRACLQCGIDYKDLQLPVELTLWVDPDEVTCRFGENKGSHCLVAKFKDGELRDNNFNIDMNSIDIEIFQQATETSRQQSLLESPDYHKHQHNQHNHNNSYHSLHQGNNNNNHNHHQQQQHSSSSSSSNNNNHHHHQHHQQSQPPIHHRSNIGKSTMFPSYHQNYLNMCDNNGNPIYYYF